MDTIAQRLARFGHALALDKLPPEVVHAAKRCIVDVMGAALAGATHPAAAKVRDLPSAQAPGNASLIGVKGAAREPAVAALCNAVAAHVYDHDDTCYDGIVHGSAAVWPAVLACAQAAGINGVTLLEAFIAGVETEYAVGRAMSERAYFSGWWTSALLGAIGAAAGAARAFRLDAAATCNAISLAAAQGAGMRVMFGTAAKPYGLGRAAQLGVEAAYFARAGLDAPADVFESARGFNNVVGSEFDESRFHLGQKYSLIDPGIAFKLYPACSATQAATEAVLDLMREHRLNAEDVAAVDCEVTPLVDISLVYPEPRTTPEAQFSMNYAIACALRYGDFGIQRMISSCYDTEATKKLMRKVRMTRCETLEATPEGRRRNPEGARVTLRLNDRREFAVYNAASTGMPHKPVADAALDRKFMECAGVCLDAQAAAKLLGRLRAVEVCTDVRKLFDDVT